MQQVLWTSPTHWEHERELMAATGTLPARDPGPVSLRVAFYQIDPAKNRARFYTLHWQRSLWQEEALVQRWGRIGTAGRHRATFYAQREQAQEMITRVIQHRLQHGYHIVEWR